MAWQYPPACMHAGLMRSGHTLTVTQQHICVSSIDRQCPQVWKQPAHYVCLARTRRYRYGEEVIRKERLSHNCFVPSGLFAQHCKYGPSPRKNTSSAEHVYVLMPQASASNGRCWEAPSARHGGRLALRTSPGMACSTAGSSTPSRHVGRCVLQDNCIIQSDHRFMGANSVASHPTWSQYVASECSLNSLIATNTQVKPHIWSLTH